MPDGWEQNEVGCGSGYSYRGDVDKFVIKFDDAEEALEELNEDPSLYEGVFNLWNQHIWLIKKGLNFKPNTAKPQDGCTWTTMTFDTGLGDGSDAFEDEYSEDVLAGFKGKDISGSLKRIGRGEGLYDIEGLEVLGVADPNDVSQGSIGDCWLMASMSAVAEFEGMLEQNFVTKEVNEEGLYEIRLFCIVDKEWKTYEIDDRLFTQGGKPRFGKASADGEIWSPLLEKAFAVHAGGWDPIIGGSPMVGMACITGCLDTFRVWNNAKSVSGYSSYTYTKGKHDWNTSTGNHFKGKGRGYYDKWPDNGASEISGDAFFDYLCRWDEAGYIMCAGTGRPGTSGNHDNDNQGIADSHAYSVIQCKKDVCGKFKMIQFRNPWGSGEFKGGAGTKPWYDGGRMWDDYPEAADELDYAPDPDDGLFWMDFEDACNYFWSFNICCAETAGKRQPKPISNKKRSQRAAQASVTKSQRIIDAMKAEFFDPIDVSGDGILTTEEVQSLAQKMSALGEHDKVPADSEQIQEMVDAFLEHLDQNDDGEVTWPEMLQAMAAAFTGDEDITLPDFVKMLDQQFEGMSEDDVNDAINAIQNLNPFEDD